MSILKRTAIVFLVSMMCFASILSVNAVKFSVKLPAISSKLNQINNTLNDYANAVYTDKEYNLRYSIQYVT